MDSLRKNQLHRRRTPMLSQKRKKILSPALWKNGQVVK